MDFDCKCKEPMCVCTNTVRLSSAEQDEILLARIRSDSIHSEIRSQKTCQECLDGMHQLDPMSQTRSRKVAK